MLPQLGAYVDMPAYTRGGQPLHSRTPGLKATGTKPGPKYRAKRPRDLQDALQGFCAAHSITSAVPSMAGGGLSS